jgi:hypothetical protein
MTIPVGIFTVMLYLAVVAVALGAGYLLVVLLLDWKNRSVW